MKSRKDLRHLVDLKPHPFLETSNQEGDGSRSNSKQSTPTAPSSLGGVEDKRPPLPPLALSTLAKRSSFTLVDGVVVKAPGTNPLSGNSATDNKNDVEKKRTVLRRKRKNKKNIR